MIDRRAADNNFRHVTDIDRPSVPRRDEQKADVGNTVQRLPCCDSGLDTCVTDRAGKERAIGAFHLVDKLLQRHAE